MGFLSKRVDAIIESQTIAMARKSRELKAAGVDIISLSLGEPDFTTPAEIKAAAIKAIETDFSYYTHVSGYLELRQAICTKLKRDNHLDYTPENIVVSTGAKQCIANAVMCLVNPGDEVILPAPFWVSYEQIVSIAEGKAVIVHCSLEQNFKIDAATLEKYITPKTKMIMISSPCNPTGAVYSKEELTELVKVIEKYPNIFILADEIYEHINFVGEHYSFARFESIKDRVITINGVSKGFAMTGWRGGYMAAHKDIAVACDKMQGQFTSATSSITQKAIEAAMHMPKESTYPMRDAFLRRRNLMVEKLQAIPGLKCNIPEGAFYLYPEITHFIGKSHGGITIKNGTDMCMYLLDKAHVAVVPGAAFGEDKYIRLSYATSDDKLVIAADRIKTALALLV
jgi:aspartate aminotransferase